MDAGSSWILGACARIDQDITEGGRFDAVSRALIRSASSLHDIKSLLRQALEATRIGMRLGAPDPHNTSYPIRKRNEELRNKLHPPRFDTEECGALQITGRRSCLRVGCSCAERARKLARRQLPDRLGPFTLPLNTTTGRLEVGRTSRHATLSGSCNSKAGLIVIGADGTTTS